MRLLGRLEPITLLNARVVNTGGVCAGSLRVAGGRVAALDGQPQAGDRVADLDGAFVYPGLINAHDHLELNNFPRLKWRERHNNARDWIAGFAPRFKTDPRLSEPLKVPLNDRLLLGGIKNLLCGTTTVCHHDPLYVTLRWSSFPVRVVQRYGWSHSLLVDGEAEVARARRRTPRDWPWIIHAAEGTDAEAAGELAKLESLGCLGANTVLVHGVGLGPEDRARLLAASGALIWCPSSNFFTLGATAEVGALAARGRAALGTDSRLTGERDLLAELGRARATSQVDAMTLFQMVTTHAAAVLRLPAAGRLEPGQPADLLVLPAADADPFDNLVASERSSVRLVMVRGRALYGDRSLIPNVLTSAGEASPVVLDGVPKWLRRGLARRLWANRAPEPGLAPDQTGAAAQAELAAEARG